jgi:uncharacterized repeat protein (TIGR01451 family)
MTGFGRKALLALVVVALGVGTLGAQPLALNPEVGAVGPIVRGAADCAGGEIYDDGTAENGYSGNPAVVSNFQGAMQFTPAAYPGTYDTVCLGLVSLGGPNLTFNIEVHDDDGAGGTPGTLLGTVAASAAGIPGGLPCAFYSFDVTSMGLNIPSGSVFIGVQWNPQTFPSRFICADESGTTPLRAGFANFNTGSGWQPFNDPLLFPAYRALILRAIPGMLGGIDSDLNILKTGSFDGSQIIYTVTVTNDGPDDASGVVVTDNLPAEVTYVSDDCGGSNVPPWTWNIGDLINGASATCHITVDVTPEFFGPIVNTAMVTADQNDPGPGDESSTSTIVVEQGGSVLEIPTLGTIGFALLALLLAAGAIFMIRRRATV